MAARLGGATWRSGLAEWASRTGFIDGFRSECRETRQRLCRPLAAGGLSLADLIGGATWRCGLGGVFRPPPFSVGSHGAGWVRSHAGSDRGDGRGAASCQKKFPASVETPGSGEGGIRTPGAIADTPVFKTGALNRSATPPLFAAIDLAWWILSRHLPAGQSNQSPTRRGGPGLRHAGSGVGSLLFPEFVAEPSLVPARSRSQLDLESIPIRPAASGLRPTRRRLGAAGVPQPGSLLSPRSPTPAAVAWLFTHGTSARQRLQGEQG